MPTISAMMATTTTISTRVMPRREAAALSAALMGLFILPTEDVGIDPSPPGWPSAPRLTISGSSA